MTDTEDKLLPREEDPDKIPDSQKSEETEPIEAEYLKGLPPEAKKVIEFGMSMYRSGPMPHPIASKINEKHIDKLLEIGEKDDERAFLNEGRARKYHLTYVIIAAALFIFLTVFLLDSNKDLYKELIKILVIFLGGMGSGYGLKTYLDR